MHLTTELGLTRKNEVLKRGVGMRRAGDSHDLLALKNDGKDHGRCVGLNHLGRLIQAVEVQTRQRALGAPLSLGVLQDGPPQLGVRLRQGHGHRAKHTQKRPARTGKMLNTHVRADASAILLAHSEVHTDSAGHDAHEHSTGL